MKKQPRDRITITIKSELLEQIDALVDGEFIRNKSQAVEILVARGLENFVSPVGEQGGEEGDGK